MATQVAGRPSVGGDTFSMVVYAVAVAIGIVAILIGVLSPMQHKAQIAFIWLGAWAVASTIIAIIHRASGGLAVRGSSDEYGPRVDLLARLGVDGWAFWVILGLFAVAIIGVLAA